MYNLLRKIDKENWIKTHTLIDDVQGITGTGIRGLGGKMESLTGAKFIRLIYVSNGLSSASFNSEISLLAYRVVRR